MADGGKYYKLEIAPGIDRAGTQYAAENTWYDVDKVRFRNGLAENMFGWQQLNQNPVQLDGVTRAMHTWADLQGRSYLAAGTHKKLYVTRGDTVYDITPIVNSVTVSTGMDTKLGSNIVSVSVSNNIRDGHFVMIQQLGATLGGNVDFNETTGPNSTWEVTQVSTTGFAFAYTTVAQATSAGGAGHVISYLLEPGSFNGALGTGWGTSIWDDGTWGTVRNLDQQGYGRYWSMDNWGEDLLALPNQGRIYTWHLSAGLSTRSTLVTASPTTSDFMLVSDQRFVVTFGTTNALGTYSPMTVRWSASENFNDWVASVGNDAGDLILTGGSRIMTAVKSRGEILVLTDKTAWIMRYQGEPFIYGMEQVGNNCGCISFHGAVDVNGVVYWMSDHGFHVYNGQVQDIPCPVSRYIFDARQDGIFNFDKRWKIYASSNVRFNEIIWFYQSKDGVDCDRYVIYNYGENVWYYGTMKRSAWEDRGNFSNPIAAGWEGTSTSVDTKALYLQDVQELNTGLPNFHSYIESGAIDMEDGDKMFFINRVIPDFDITEGQLNLYFKYRKYPGQEWSEKGPFRVSTSTELINPRLRGRSFAIRIDTSTTCVWTMGAMRLAIQEDGEA